MPLPCTGLLFSVFVEAADQSTKAYSSEICCRTVHDLNDARSIVFVSIPMTFVHNNLFLAKVDGLI